MVVEESEVSVYRCINRCVRRAFLSETILDGNCFDHRQSWIQDRLAFLAGVFAADVLGFIMSNHLHAVLRNRPDGVVTWSDEVVARRWWAIFTQRPEPEGSVAAPHPKALSQPAWSL